MGFAWSLPTGFETPITYFYVIYFAILLAHRQIRDDENCAKKYVSSLSAAFGRYLLLPSTGMGRTGIIIRSLCRTV
jgi:hypothetical protein